MEGTNRAAFNDERITSTEFAVNTNAWILRQPKRSEMKDENGSVLSRSEYFYDDGTHLRPAGAAQYAALIKSVAG